MKNDAITITAPKSTVKPASVLAIRARSTGLIPTCADFSVFAIITDTDANVKITFPDDLDTNTKLAILKVTLSSSKASRAKNASVVIRKDGDVIKQGKTNASAVFAFQFKRSESGAVTGLSAFAPGSDGCNPSKTVNARIAPFSPPMP